VAVKQAQLSGAAKRTTHWLDTNGDYTQARYHGGTQITTANVHRLRPAFKAGQRTNDAGTMSSVSKTLSDEDIEDLAQYLATLD
jgi:cytochrome c553